MNWDRSKVYFPNWIMADIRATEWNGSMWTDQGGTATGNVTTTGTITSNSVSSFNLFTFGSISWVLPVTLIDFTARRQDDYINIAWTTANENRLHHFVVERSDNGTSFYAIGQSPARNSGAAEQYTTRDYTPIKNIAYYRLRSVDADGKETLSKIVSITDMAGSDLALLTNPVYNQIKLRATSRLNGEFDYRISAINGQVIQKGSLLIRNGGQYEISLKTKLQPGIYTIAVMNQQQSFEYKFIAL
jgi:hypothetical protein